MLNTLRKGAASWVAKIFIGLLVLSFAVWGISDIFGGLGRTTLATVGDVKISSEDYRVAFQNEIRALSARMQRNLSTEEARVLGLDARVLDQLVTNASLDHHAADLKLGISDKSILDMITKERAFQDSSGAFSRAAFEQILRSNGLTEGGFVANRRLDSMRQQIVGAFTRGISAPKVLLSAIERYSKAKRTIRYFVLPASAAGKIEEPDEAKLKKYYDAHRHTFTAPEYRKLAVLTLRPELLKDAIKISDEELKKVYDASADRYVTPERRQIQQIAFKSLADAEKAHQSLKSGQSFVEVAKASGFTESDIDLGLLTEAGLTDKKIREAAFALKVDTFSAAIEGTLTTVIVKVTKIEPKKVRTFDDVKAELSERQALEKARNDALDIHDAVEDARASGSTLKEISEKHGAKFIEIAATDQRGNAPDGKAIEGIPAFQVVVRSAFASDVGVENDPVEAGNGDFVWFDVVDVTASKLKPFESIKAEAAEKWKKNEIQVRMAKKSKDILLELRTGKSLDDVAKSFGAEVKKSEPLIRTKTSGDLTEAAVAQAFALAKDGFGTARAKSGDARLVFQVEKIELPPLLKDNDSEKLNRQIAPRIAQDIFRQYVTGLQRTYVVDVNQQNYNILTGREQPPAGSAGRGSF
ncbi:MAG: SurA N-terminal domain-containing protein [Methyloligellaceae bacterium]